MQAKQRDWVNFSAGPAGLPAAVKAALHDEGFDINGAGLAAFEISHRSVEFVAIAEQLHEQLRRVAAIPDSHEILFMHGGASQQALIAPMNLVRPGRVASYVLTGHWGEKAWRAGAEVAAVEVSATAAASGYDRILSTGEWQPSARADLLHFTSNETIHGVEYADDPRWADTDTCLVCDMSSNIFSRPIHWSRYGMVYACAQKNAGIAGVTLVVIDKRYLARGEQVPKLWRYAYQLQRDSMANTPATFSWYALLKTIEWLRDEGGLATMDGRASARAKTLYDVIAEHPGFYANRVQAGSRSRMNVVFSIVDTKLEPKFVETAAQHGFYGVKGHRALGGLRVSLYNGIKLEDVQRFAGFMRTFAAAHG